ncbi:hypothetical protein ULG90_15055 [Halopseudomonas pachastrellae]|nr:hypothetical protein ULG90_15055 [Halopseudomonas pachastrellae]
MQGADLARPASAAGGAAAATIKLQLTPQAGQRLQADTLLKADLQAEARLPKEATVALAGPVSAPLSGDWQLVSDALQLSVTAPQLDLPALRARGVSGLWPLRVQLMRPLCKRR